METRIVSVQTQNNLSVVQFISSNIDTFDYVSLSNAFTNNLIEIKELGEGASVNDVFVINHSDKFVFMMDGDIIQGAKQNRVINTSILLAPKKKTQIQVSCVEQGRWRHVSNKFGSSDLCAPLTMRSSKHKDVFTNLKEGKAHYADQSKVWDDVESYAARFRVKSETSNLGDIYSEKKAEFEKAEAEFKCGENVNGFAIFIENEFVSLDLFNSSVVYRDYFGKIIKGALFELNYEKKSKKKVDESEIKYKTLDILDKTEEFEKNIFNGAGVGEEKRFQSQELIGLELMYDNFLIHQSIIKIS